MRILKYTTNMKKKTIISDSILIGSLIIISVVALILVNTFKKTSNKARVSVANQIIETIDLALDDKTYEIEGTKGTLVLHVHNKSIAVISSNCPHQDCVRMGYVKDSSHPIVCAYNEVVIVIEGSSKADVGI